MAPKSYLLATIHRAENTDDPARLRAIFYALAAVAREWPVVMPLHPRTRAALAREGLADQPGIRIIDPVGYLEMAALERHARMIVTDSGGVQKEAYFYRVPCVTLRDETEWVELVEVGWNRLVSPTDPNRILQAIHAAHGTTGQDVNLYGGGDAASHIVDVLVNA